MSAHYTPEPWIRALRSESLSHPLYKPALLLVVLDAIDRGQASPLTVLFDERLEASFDELLARAGEPRGAGKCWQPFFHLATHARGRSPVWHLTRAGALVEPGKRAKSRGGLRRIADAARFRSELADHLVTPVGRAGVREEIYRWVTLGADPEAGLRLVAAHHPAWPAIRSELAGLREAVDRPFRLFREHPEVHLSEQTRYARDTALRLEILPLYDYRCALCDLRLRYHHTIEATAAHIVPVRASGADDLRNVITLCRTHHWAFDEGFWSVDEGERAIVLEPEGDDTTDLAAIQQLRGKKLRLPAQDATRPHKAALEWHREHLFLRHCSR
ncbi:MAG: hypothetical protein EVA89_13140 [Sandaracinaceae bacterium]|nr:MAG: hypothetical protein EVA89_13140 [Sandaracinaceae bacterium]